ncbi:hypothetical protein LDH02_17380, partial [Mycobacterium tuberculosis]
AGIQPSVGAVGSSYD